MDAFEAAFALVVGVEGGYVKDGADPGGATKFGISARSHPDVDIARLTLEDAKAIYARDYWARNRCGEMPWRWGLALFDGSVNQGEVVPLLQRALRTVEDGFIGPETMAALAHAGDDDFDGFLALRAERYAATSEFSRYGLGWLKRLFRVAQAAEHPPS
jgi:lysozyme family protein